MDYNSLVTQIRQYAKRDDAFFVDQIPNFINQGINRIYSEAKNIGFETTVTGNLTLDNPVLDKPANWKETISFSITDDRIAPSRVSFLKLRTLEFCKTYWSNVTVTSTPVFFANYLAYAQFYFAPTPDYAYPFQLIYLSTPLFNVQNPNNFLTDRYPSLLLYSCLLEAAPFLKDDARIPIFENLYQRALQSVNKDAAKLYTDRSTRRDKD